MTARPLAPEADLAHVLDLAKVALRTGTMIDPEDLLCDLLGLDQADLHAYLTDPAQAAAWDALRSLEARMHELGYFDQEEPARTLTTEPGTWSEQDARPAGAGDNWLENYRPPEPAEPDQSQPASRARAREVQGWMDSGSRAAWRQAEAGTVQHLVHAGRPLCGSDDAGPWRTVAGTPRCPACAELEDVLANHG